MRKWVNGGGKLKVGGDVLVGLKRWETLTEKTPEVDQLLKNMPEASDMWSDSIHVAIVPHQMCSITFRKTFCWTCSFLFFILDGFRPIRCLFPWSATLQQQSHARARNWKPLLVRNPSSLDLQIFPLTLLRPSVTQLWDSSRRAWSLPKHRQASSSAFAHTCGDLSSEMFFGRLVKAKRKTHK